MTSLTALASTHANLRPATQVIGEARGAQVVRQLGDCSRHRISAVQWQHDPTDVRIEGMAQNVLAFHIGSPMAVTKTSGGRRVVKRPVRGAATLMRSDRESCWTLPEACQVLHLYIGDAAFETFREDNNLKGDARPEEFFALEDRWLHHYFQLLCYELDLGGGAADVDSGTLFLSQSEPLLIRHLLRLDSAQGRARGDLNKRVSPLRPFLLRRVEAFVEARLDEAIAVGDLAEQVHLSADHFLKAFQAATGVTPYQYVMNQRLQRAQALLRETSLTVADVGARVGFRNVSNFCLRFQKYVGMTPAHYRQHV